jgi:hypothetical protein
MKKVYLIAIALLLVGSYNAQAQLKLGLKGGLNFPSLNEQNGTIDYNAKTGWHGGVMVEIKLPIIGIQGDILYSQTAFEIPNSDDLQNAYIDIPIVAKLYLFKILTVQAGPQFSFLTSSKLGDIDFKDDWNESNFRLVAGLGVNLGPLDIHGRFIFPAKTEIANTVNEFKDSNIQLSVGFWLKK